MRAAYVKGEPADRFWPKVTWNGPLSEHRPDLGSCWLWTAALRPDGYGVFNAGGGQLVRAHRWAWEQEHGPVPEGLELDHLCRVRNCVRPTHLEAVTHKVNSERGLPGGRSWRRSIPACPEGHPYDEANTYALPGSGFRRCRACRNARDRQRRARSKP